MSERLQQVSSVLTVILLEFLENGLDNIFRLILEWYETMDTIASTFLIL